MMNCSPLLIDSAGTETLIDEGKKDVLSVIAEEQAEVASENKAKKVKQPDANKTLSYYLFTVFFNQTRTICCS